jgi:hypothetical protein
VKFVQEVNMHATGEMFILALVAIVFLGAISLVSLILNRRHGGSQSTPAIPLSSIPLPTSQPPAASIAANPVVPPPNSPAQETISSPKPVLVEQTGNKSDLKKSAVPQARFSISKREFLATGILFFLFSVSLFTYMGGPFVWPLWAGVTWHGPVWLSTLKSVVSIIVLVITAVIALSCLVGAFSSKLINRVLNKLTERPKLWTWGEFGYTTLFFLAFMLNFFLSWVQKLVGVAKNPIIFYIILAVGCIFLAAIIVSQERKRGNRVS